MEKVLIVNETIMVLEFIVSYFILENYRGIYQESALLIGDVPIIPYVMSRYYVAKRYIL